MIANGRALFLFTPKGFLDYQSAQKVDIFFASSSTLAFTLFVHRVQYSYGSAVFIATSRSCTFGETYDHRENPRVHEYTTRR